MSLRKPFRLASLVLIIAFAAPARPNSREWQSNLPSPHLIAGRAQLDRAPGEISSALFLPVQTKNVKALGPGKILVASRDLGDPAFAHTVVLLVQCDENGVVGLILNRRTHFLISNVLTDMKAAKGVADPVYLGGPVAPMQVFSLLQSQARIEGAQSIFAGVYLITAKPLFEQTIASKPGPNVFRIFVGYAGWNLEQLRTEIALGAWFIFPADTKVVFNGDPDSLWPQMIRQTELKIAGTGRLLPN